MSNPEFSDIGACVFDAYGTLFDVGSAVAKHRGSLGDKADALSAIWRTKQLEYTWLRSLMGAHVDFRRITGDGLDFALDTLELDAPDLRQDLMALYMELDAYPEVPDVLRALDEAGTPCAILSNGSPDMLAAAVANAGIGERLAAVLSVEDVGVFKPHPSVYQMAVDRLGVEAGRICFMSSNAWDVAGAAAFGFRVAWVNRFGQKPERLPGKPRAELRSLAELPPLLGL